VVEYGDFECPYCGRAEPPCASCSATSRTSATYGGTRRCQTCILTRAGGTGLGGRRRSERVLGDARPAARAPGQAANGRSAVVREPFAAQTKRPTPRTTSRSARARVLPTAGGCREAKLFVPEGDGLRGTPLLLTVVAIMAADSAFAIDSIPAVFAVTRGPRGDLDVERVRPTRDRRASRAGRHPGAPLPIRLRAGRGLSHRGLALVRPRG
jgi:hypothetical protein